MFFFSSDEEDQMFLIYVALFAFHRVLSAVWKERSVHLLLHREVFIGNTSNDSSHLRDCFLVRLPKLVGNERWILKTNIYNFILLRYHKVISQVHPATFTNLFVHLLRVFFFISFIYPSIDSFDPWLVWLFVHFLFFRHFVWLILFIHLSFTHRFILSILRLLLQ